MKHVNPPLNCTFLCIRPSCARHNRLSSCSNLPKPTFSYHGSNTKGIEPGRAVEQGWNMESTRQDHPCELNQACLRYVKGVWVWYFDWHWSPTSHICSWKALLSLSMSSPPSDPSVLISPSCRPFSFLSFSSFPLPEGGREEKEKERQLFMHTMWFTMLSSVWSALYLFSTSSCGGEGGEEVE